jgi:hypothetical protein
MTKNEGAYSMAWPPHITVATIVKDQDRYLMVEEIIDRQAVLNQPAGHLEPGESLFDAAPWYCNVLPTRNAGPQRHWISSAICELLPLS